MRINLALAVIVLLSGPAAAPAAAVEPAPTRLASPEIFGYLPYYQLDARIDYGAITTIAYFGLGARADGSLARTGSDGRPTRQYARWLGAEVDEVIERAHAAGGRVVLTVGRFAWTAAAIATTETLLSDPAARSRLATEITDEVVSRGVDGANLDFEPILASQRANYAAFVRELRATFDAADPGLQLTVAATAFEGDETYALLGELTEEGSADAVVVMAYPARIDRLAGGLAPMDSATTYHLSDYVADYLVHVAPDRIILALPWYGRRSPTRTSALHSAIRTNTALYGKAGNIIYSQALTLAQRYGRRYDPIEMSAWSAYRARLCKACRLTWAQVYYDDVDSLAAKIEWASGLGLRGVGMWALGFDGSGPELWSMLRVAFRGLVDDLPPTGTAKVAADRLNCSSTSVRLLFDLDDGDGGSGVAYIRVSDQPALAGDGVLASGRTYPATPQVCWPAAGDTAYAQWRDVAGNWSPATSVGW